MLSRRWRFPRVAPRPPSSSRLSCRGEQYSSRAVSRALGGRLSESVRTRDLDSQLRWPALVSECHQCRLNSIRVLWLSTRRKRASRMLDRAHQSLQTTRAQRTPPDQLRLIKKATTTCGDEGGHGHAMTQHAWGEGSPDCEIRDELSCFRALASLMYFRA